MAEPSGAEPPSSATGDVEEAFEAERTIARIAGAGLPAIFVLSAIVVGYVAGVGPALLVVAFGALVGTIALLWASLRTLSGDAPLPVGLEQAAAQAHEGSELAERKRRVLRALKDLESEHAIGKIDDTDYKLISTRYRDEAKSVLRELDQVAAPSRAEAERLALEFIGRRGLGAKRAKPREHEHDGDKRHDRIACPSCGTSNEPDATFCKQCGSAMSSAASKVHETK